MEARHASIMSMQTSTSTLNPCRQKRWHTETRFSSFKLRVIQMQRCKEQGRGPADERMVEA